VIGWLDDTLKVSVTAPPEKGRANAELLALLADALGLPRASLRVVTGLTGSRKLIEVDGLDESELRRRLSAPGS
jgi:uncharacterized protein YggU (UPF0235/DUF167 family)